MSFSAALTYPMVTSGTIIFDKIFVNEGNFYNPRTGKPDMKMSVLTFPFLLKEFFVLHCATVNVNILRCSQVSLQHRWMDVTSLAPS